MTPEEEIEKVAEAIKNAEIVIDGLSFKPITPALEREAMAKAAIQAMKDMGYVRQEWLPIETAPKPSGQILLSAKNFFRNYEVANGHYYKLQNKWVYDCHFRPKAQPDFWQKLPQPPKRG